MLDKKAIGKLKLKALNLINFFFLKDAERKKFLSLDRKNHFNNNEIN